MKKKTKSISIILTILIGLSGCTKASNENQSINTPMNPSSNLSSTQLSSTTKKTNSQMDSSEVLKFSNFNENDKSKSNSYKINKVKNNGHDVIQVDAKTYYVTDNLSYEDYQDKGAMYSIECNTELKKINNIGGNKVWSNGVSLYTSSYIENKIYKIDIDTKKSKKILDGYINYLNSDNILYYTAYDKGNNFKCLYKIDLGTLKNEVIAVGKKNTWISYITTINSIMYYTETTSKKLTIYAYDMKNGKSKALTTNTLIEQDADIEVTKMFACGDWLIYTIGNYQGTGHYFFGDMYRIKFDGTGKKMLKINNEKNTNFFNDEFTTIDNKIIYNDNNTDAVDLYYIMNLDMSNKQKVDKKVYSIIDVIDGYIYYKTETGDIHKCKSDMSNDTLIVKSKNLPNYKKNKDEYYYDISIISNTMYFTADVWGARKGYSWIAQFINSTFNMIKLDGSDLKTLSRVSSEFDRKK